MAPPFVDEQQRVMALAVESDGSIDLSRVTTVGEEARRDELREGRAREVVVSLLADDALEHRPARGDPANAHPRADRL